MITPAYGLTATERVLPSFTLDWTTGFVQSTVDVTRAGVATYIDSNGDLQNAVENTQRVDYSTGVAGLLVEESRTNSLVNSTNVGAAVGSPGTLPTNWTINTSGLVSEVVAIGSENGVNYIDVKLSGTTTATNPLVGFQAYGLITAAQNEQWAFSSWLKIVSGSTANISSIVFFAQERTSTGTLTANLLGSALSIDGTLSRLNHVFTITNASTERLQPLLRLNAASGVAIDITLRIGMPQVEKGAFPTSYIPTEASAVTRNADVATVTGTNFSDFWNATEGGLLVEFTTGGKSTAIRTAAVSDGSANNKMDIALASGGGAGPYLFVVAGGVNQVTASGGYVFQKDFDYKWAMAYKEDSYAWSNNADTPVLDNSGLVPTVDRLNIGSDFSGGSILNGHIKKLLYWPQRLTNSEIQAIAK